mgnify:CR=1 FL=1
MVAHVVGIEGNGQKYNSGNITVKVKENLVCAGYELDVASERERTDIGKHIKGYRSNNIRSRKYCRID